MSETGGLTPRELYNEYRRRISEEHTLLSNRMGWLLVTQSFLFSPLAISLRPDGQVWLRVMIPVMGIGICLAVLPAIRGAVGTLRVFVIRQQLLIQQHPELSVLDPEQGPVKRRKGMFERSVSYVGWMPVALLAVWLTVLIMVLVGLQ